MFVRRDKCCWGVQMPAKQVDPAEHCRWMSVSGRQLRFYDNTFLPQLPQLPGSVSVLTQDPEQGVSPGEHVEAGLQIPATHEDPVEH